MTIGYAIMLIIFSIALGGIQIILKKAVMNSFIEQVPLSKQVADFLINPYFVSSILLYLSMGFFWVWIIARVPVSRAYPFVALSFISVIILEKIIFQEPISIKVIMGLFSILIGLILIVSAE